MLVITRGYRKEKMSRLHDNRFSRNNVMLKGGYNQNDTNLNSIDL